MTVLPVASPINNGGAFAQRIGFAVPGSGIETTGIVRGGRPCVLDLATMRSRKTLSIAWAANRFRFLPRHAEVQVAVQSSDA